MQIIKLLSAFFVRDLYTELSYKLAFAISLSSIFFSTFSFFFLGKLLNGNNITGLDAYDGDFFAFVIIGIALSGYFTLGLSAFARALRQAQTTGTLEAMLMTPTHVSLVIVGSAVYSYAFTTFRVAVYLGLGLFLGLNLSNANFLGAIATLLISIVAFASIGIMAASIIMIVKRGDPVTAIFGSFANLISGVLYPIEVLPDWLIPVANLLPLTYALRAMRDALLNGASWSQLAPNLLILAGFCVVLFPLSLMAFRYAVEWARREGTLTHY